MIRVGEKITRAEREALECDKLMLGSELSDEIKIGKQKFSNRRNQKQLKSGGDLPEKKELTRKSRSEKRENKPRIFLQKLQVNDFRGIARYIEV